MKGMIGISTAIPPEYNAARNAFKLPNPDKNSPFREIQERGGRCFLFLTGPGQNNAGRALDRLLPSHSIVYLLDTGTCGALAPSLVPGDLIIDSSDKQEEWISFLKTNYSGGRVIKGTQLCVDHDIQNLMERDYLYEKTGATACNRESDIIFRKAAEAGIKVASIRMVSDNAGPDIQKQFKKEGIKRLPGFYSSLFTFIFSDLF